MSYLIGQVSVISATFTDTTGAAIDPTVVKFKYKTPAGVITELTYGTDAAVVKNSTGHYSVNLSLAESGWYKYRWYSTGTGQAAEEGSFEVAESEVTA